MKDSTQRFSNRVDNYVKYRPSYPQAVLDLLRETCGLTNGWVIADIGSGPGNLARLFLDRGNRVFGVEPNREMREAGERLLGGDSRFTTVQGTAEATTLASDSVDLVVAGQAFHWFQPDAAKEEFARILRSPRWVALVWNERPIDSTPFLADYEKLVRRFGTDYEQVAHRDAAATERMHEFFGDSRYQRAVFPNEQRFDFAGLRGRLLSSSYVPEAGQPGYEPMLHELQTLFDTHQSQGIVRFDYDTAVYYGQI